MTIKTTPKPLKFTVKKFQFSLIFVSLTRTFCFLPRARRFGLFSSLSSLKINNDKGSYNMTARKANGLICIDY